MDFLRHLRTHTADGAQVLDAGGLQAIDGSKVVGQQTGHRPADVVDAERNQEPDKCRRLARLDPIEQVLGGLFGKALQGQ